MSADLSLDEARRMALAAQGFDRRRPAGRVRPEHVRGAIRRLGLVQIDMVNVVAPAHHHVLFSRLGAYDRALFDRVVYGARDFTEQWAHVASIVPVETWPLLRHRMEDRRRPDRFARLMQRHPGYTDWVHAQIRARGPLSAADLDVPPGAERRLAKGAWIGTLPRAALEMLFSQGTLAVAERGANHARRFDLTERLISTEHHGRRLETHEAQRQLLRLAARAHGLGTAGDLADYYRMPMSVARARLAELADAGELRTVRVAGWRERAYVHPAARLPRRIDATSLLSPFDPLVWFRPRTARLFEFDYRFEIFVPQAQRRWGVYVLPFLLGDRLVARVDLKAERGHGRLVVRGAVLERGADAARVAEALAQELHSLAHWLGLESVRVAARGAFARRLAGGLRRTTVRGRAA